MPLSQYSLFALKISNHYDCIHQPELPFRAKLKSRRLVFQLQYNFPTSSFEGKRCHSLVELYIQTNIRNSMKVRKNKTTVTCYVFIFQNTYKNCGRKGHRFPGGRCYSTLSTRSSQVNSHSITDSYSHQSTLRYLDAEMARLHDSRRPLVVSFRRKKLEVPTRRSKQVTFNSQFFSSY